MRNPPIRFSLSTALCLLAVCLTGWASVATAAAGESATEDVTAPPTYEEFIVIPLRVHVLRATDLPEVDCKLSDDDVRRVVGKVNAVVWHKAGVHFALESIRREPAGRQDEFRAWRERFGGLVPLDVYPLLRPDPSGADEKPSAPEAEAPAFEGLHVYYVHEMPTNGVYFGDPDGHAAGFAFVKETASLRTVEGGIDEPIPRVTAHELGHALGLRHRQNWTNLMQSGTTGTLLNAAEVSTAREVAKKLAGAAPVATWRERAVAADGAREAERAKQVWGWLAEIPGDGAAEAAERRDAVMTP